MKPITILAALLLIPLAGRCADADTKTVRVFIFAGQSNMEGADSKVKDIQRFPPFAGLDAPQEKVMFSYNIGREEKQASKGWVALQPVGQMVGPELSFARRVAQETGAPVAIIKCAAGGTTLGGDWNPDVPGGFKLYPLALELVRASLAELEKRKVPYRIEGFMWHQGENDMFDSKFRPNYGSNLKNFLASWRRDLRMPGLKFYIGELAHGFHDQTIGFDDARVTAVWEKFCASGKAKSVLTSTGPLRAHYGLTNSKEFFAEMTEAYFGSNDFYPFVAGELQQAEPETFALLAEIWGALPGRAPAQPAAAGEK